jgi:hypothetical protein
MALSLDVRCLSILLDIRLLSSSLPPAVPAGHPCCAQAITVDPARAQPAGVLWYDYEYKAA